MSIDRKLNVLVSWAGTQHLWDRMLTSVAHAMRTYQAASLFQVSVWWIDKALARALDGREHGATAGQPRGPSCGHAMRRSGSAEGADVTLAELRAWLLETDQISISLRGIWKTLRRLDLTRKKRPSTPRSRAVPMSPRQGGPGATSSRSSIQAG